MALADVATGLYTILVLALLAAYLYGMRWLLLRWRRNDLRRWRGW